MSPDFVLTCLFLPALAALSWAIGGGISRAVHRRRNRSQCRRHVRSVLVTQGGLLIELCHTCDAGEVVDGRWQFAAAVEADHTFG